MPFLATNSFRTPTKTLNKSLEHNFVELLEEHQNIVHKVCRLYTNDQASHKDLFQEITIQLWKAYPKFRGDSKFSTWMYRVALNTAITLYRKSTRKIKTQEFDTVQFKIKTEEYDQTEEVQLKLMYQAIHELNDIEKALVLLYLEDKNYSEISDTLGISEVNARVKMNRVKKKLKTILNP
ncbi:DNA-directed RNA polymerase sigma-70 factor [Mangrovimonas yunxiaonensis]|nr:DNA-directed RNA polymerase sigma-70 factor [Mangrovimonas yunxiaonensis]